MKVTDEGDRVRGVPDALRAMAAEDRTLAPSPAVEVALLADVRTIARARRRRVVVVTVSAAAVLAIAASVSWIRRAEDRRAPAPRSAQGPEATATAFFPLTYSSLPVSNAQLIRVQVPRSALASFGLAPIDVPQSGAASTPAATVPADVLVGEDGVARAIRFVSP